MCPMAEPVRFQRYDMIGVKKPSATVKARCIAMPGILAKQIAKHRPHGRGQLTTSGFSSTLGILDLTWVHHFGHIVLLLVFEEPKLDGLNVTSSAHT
jgi:hypothetical protein